MSSSFSLFGLVVILYIGALSTAPEPPPALRIWRQGCCIRLVWFFYRQCFEVSAPVGHTAVAVPARIATHGPCATRAPTVATMLIRSTAGPALPPVNAQPVSSPPCFLSFPNLFFRGLLSSPLLLCHHPVAMRHTAVWCCRPAKARVGAQPASTGGRDRQIRS